jgi:hypothetical protein
MTEAASPSVAPIPNLSMSTAAIVKPGDFSK